MGFLSGVSTGDWVAIIVGLITVYHLRKANEYAREQNEIFREQNEIFRGQGFSNAIPSPRVAVNRWLVYRPVIALIAIALLVWVTLAYDAYDRHRAPTQWRPWWVALLVDIALVLAYSIYTHRRVMAFEKQRRVERSQIVASFLGEISKLTPVIHSAHWRTNNTQGLPVTEVLQRRLKDGLILRADNASLEVTPETDPAPGKFKHLDISYSYGTRAPVTITRWENTEFVLPEDPWLARELQKAHKEWTKPIAWTDVFKIQRMRANPVSTDPNIVFKNKLRFDLTNITGKEIYVWMPLWDSGLVPSQADPTGSRLLLERTEGSWQKGEWVQYKDRWTDPPKMKNLEGCCVKLRPNFTFESYIGLNPHALESVDGLLKRQGDKGIGTILFPVKIDGRIYEIKVPAREI
jgi:hypothetical protein